ncbi:MAG: hypothetical protein VKQ33_06695 [Candidatus Sericytochromatia bacterium]|nr:hypothetical protein [Candidatus Sericytochromatia bacterium]
MRAWLLGVVLLALGQGPALARVEDPLGLLGEGVARAVEGQLARMNAGTIDVVVVPRAPEGVAVAAEAALAARPGVAAVVVFAAREGLTGLAVAPSLRPAGFGPEQAARLIATTMPPALAQGAPSEGLIALVQELKLLEATSVPAGHLPPSAPPRWPLAVGGGALAGAALGLLASGLSRGRRRRQAVLRARVLAERGRLARLREDLASLADDLGRLEEALRPVAASALATLEAEQAALRDEWRALDARLEARLDPAASGLILAGARRAARLELGHAALAAAVATGSAAAVAAAAPLVGRWAALAEALGDEAEPVVRLTRLVRGPAPDLTAFAELLGALERVHLARPPH